MRPSFQYIRLLSVIVLLPASVQAMQHYEADIDSVEWSVNASNVRCELKQTIPRFGDVSFVHSAGGELSFLMTPITPPTEDAEALLLTTPPYWKPEGLSQELARTPLSKGKTPVYFTRKIALRMVYELDQGMQPTVLYRDWADKTEDVTVAISTVHFRDFWPEFAACQSKLLSYGFDAVKNTSALFDSGSARLNSDARELLDRVALYVKNDESVKQITITGHTDSIGFKYLNELLSKRRASAVSKYLLSKGVPKKLLVTRGKGEMRPHVSNASLTGRKFNRRVQVQLYR